MTSRLCSMTTTWMSLIRCVLHRPLLWAIFVWRVNRGSHCRAIPIEREDSFLVGGKISPYSRNDTMCGGRRETIPPSLMPGCRSDFSLTCKAKALPTGEGFKPMPSVLPSSASALKTFLYENPLPGLPLPVCRWRQYNHLRHHLRALDQSANQRF